MRRFTDIDTGTGNDDNDDNDDGNDDRLANLFRAGSRLCTASGKGEKEGGEKKEKNQETKTSRSRHGVVSQAFLAAFVFPFLFLSPTL